jgi:hypothetical protein
MSRRHLGLSDQAREASNLLAAVCGWFTEGFDTLADRISTEIRVLPYTRAHTRLCEFHDDGSDATDEKRKRVLEDAPRYRIGRYWVRPRRPVARSQRKDGLPVQITPALRLPSCFATAKAGRSVSSRQKPSNLYPVRASSAVWAIGIPHRFA